MSRDIERSKRDLSSSKLRMDSKVSSSTRYHGENLRKHKELDNVVRKARESQSNFWNKKILEVEEKDPYRWRHSGYKEMYVKGTSTESGSKVNSKSSSRCRSPRRRRSRTRSPRPISPRSPRNNVNRRSNSPRLKNRVSGSPRRRSPKNTSSLSSRPRSPLVRRSNFSKSRSPKQRKIATNSRSKISQTNYQSNHNEDARSPSSNSTCSDQSCSVCSPKSFEDRRRKINTSHSRSRSKSNSTSSARLLPNDNDVVSNNSKLHSNRLEKRGLSPFTRTSSPPLKGRSASYYSEEYYNKAKKAKLLKQKKNAHSILEEPPVPEPIKMMRKHIKVENMRVNPAEVREQNLAGESSASEDSDSSSTASHANPPKMTLSERFGKMAQWSVDRRDMENMRITKVGDSAMKVVVEGEDRGPEFGYDALAPGQYPDSLSLQGPRGLECWDDVRVRYDYYKSRGYLRDLSLDDYVKWEEWWYKYQEWLEAERYYEQWSSAQSTNRSSGNRKRRRRNNTAH